MIEQLSLFETDRNVIDVKKDLRLVKCVYEKPLRKYICEDDWYGSQCVGCANYKEKPMYQYFFPDEKEEDVETRLIDYITFTDWLYWNYPIFVGKEIKTDNWEIINGDKALRIRIDTYDKLNDDDTENHDQFISVSCDTSKHSGWSSPCDNLKKVREEIERGLNEYKTK